VHRLYLTVPAADILRWDGFLRLDQYVFNTSEEVVRAVLQRCRREGIAFTEISRNGDYGSTRSRRSDQARQVVPLLSGNGMAQQDKIEITRLKAIGRPF